MNIIGVNTRNELILENELVELPDWQAVKRTPDGNLMNLSAVYQRCDEAFIFRNGGKYNNADISVIVTTAIDKSVLDKCRASKTSVQFRHFNIMATELDTTWKNTDGVENVNIKLNTDKLDVFESAKLIQETIETVESISDVESLKELKGAIEGRRLE